MSSRAAYMDIGLALRFDDGTEVRLTARPRDLRAWQQTARNHVTLDNVLPVNEDGELAIGKFNLPELYRLAWMVARRAGEFSGSLEQFGEQVDVAVTSDEEEEPGPTNAGRSDGS